MNYEIGVIIVGLLPLIFLVVYPSAIYVLMKLIDDTFAIFDNRKRFLDIYTVIVMCALSINFVLYFFMVRYWAICK